MKRIVSLVLFVICSAFLVSQSNAQSFGGPESMKGKFVVGGNFDAGIYGHSINIGLAPQAGYRLTRSLELGIRLGYQLNYNYGDNYYGSYSCHFFSGAAYANLEVFRGLYLHAEDEEMCLLVRGQAIDPSAPSWYNSIFVGGGYRQYFNENDFLYYAFLYNLSWGYDDLGNYNSPYANPFVIRVGFCHGINHGKEKQQRHQY